jgi:hypothetical protein
MHKNNIVHISCNQKSKTNAIKLLTKQTNEQKNGINLKKLLCNNFLEYGKCNYGNKCLYSHSLDEQKVDIIREKAYKILNEFLENNNIDNKIITEINENKELHKSLLQLTKVCNDCVLGKCPGGYNCKHGAINEKYQICYNDLTSECSNLMCTMIHLSKFNIHIGKKKNINNNIVGKLLTEFFFKQKIKNNSKNSDSSESDVDSLSISSYERINNYLNETLSENPYDESIFILK